MVHAVRFRRVLSGYAQIHETLAKVRGTVPFMPDSFAQFGADSGVSQPLPTARVAGCVESPDACRSSSGVRRQMRIHHAKIEIGTITGSEALKNTIGGTFHAAGK
jgi:hypothetical protein